MPLSVTIDTAVKKLNKNITFFQPIFEAISNSLEAGAENITVTFEQENALPDITPKIIGFSIQDDGIGFTETNRNAFCELWTTNKFDLGCKGFGRLTWLYVFNSVKITSFTGDEVVNIVFNKDFSRDSIKFEKSNNPRKTTITFSGITENIYKRSDNKKHNKDLRPAADLLVLKDTIEKHLLVKLSLLNENGKKFCIRIKLQAEEQTINNDNLQKLSNKSFPIIGTDEKSYDFKLYYAFIENADKKREAYYCANYRTVDKFNDDINLEKLPTNDSVIMLLCSDYLDERVNDERTSFIITDTNKGDIPIDPISLSSINNALKQEVQNIVTEKYPEIVNDNDSEITAAIEEAPYLAKYIKADTSLVKSKNALIKSAKTAYEKEKNAVKDKFSNLLIAKNVDTDKFIDTMEEVSDIATRELGAYVIYRQQIINGLKKLSDNDEKIEALLHNLFFTKGEKDLDGIPVSSRYDNNIWLLDDKFMSYSSMFSDAKIKSILKELKNEYTSKFGANKEPDITAFYSKQNGFKDLVLIEFKAPGTNTDNKIGAIPEINRNLKFVLQRMDDVNCVYGYVITKINDELQEYLESDPNIHKLFSCSDFPMYYYPNDVLKDAKGEKRFSHIYILDADSIYHDANARNRTFLDILKKE